MPRAIRLTQRPQTLRLAAPFRISRGTEEVSETLVVRLEAGGQAGHGEAAPSGRYGESVESAAAFLDEAGDRLGDDPFALDAIAGRLAGLGHEGGGRAALDAALHDLCARLCGLPVFRLLGVERTGPPTSWTIWLGDPEDMARRAAAAAGFARLKLKLGGRDGLDVERVRAVRAAAPGVPLMVDVNEAWSLEEALEAIGHLAGLGVSYVEQPLPAGDPGGPELRRRSCLPVFADEDCHVLGDLRACAERAHGVNLKLAKAGGIREALRMAHAARAMGLGVMVGCMVESGLGIAAGCAVAPLCDHVDLDGNLLLAHDPWPGVELRDGVQVPAEAPGLGVRWAGAG